MTDHILSRRRFLTASGTGLFTGLSGCAGSNTTDATTTTQPTTTASETPTSVSTQTTTTDGEIVFDQEEYNQMYDGWLASAINRWDGRQLIQNLRQGKAPRPLGSAEYPNNQETFSKEKMLASNKTEEVVPWPAAATRIWLTEKTNGGAISTENDAFAAITTQATNEIHPELELTNPAYITTEGYGDQDNGGHGVSFFYDETHGDWYHIDTTRSQIFTLNDPQERRQSDFQMGGTWMSEDEGVWNPLTQWQKGEIDLDGLTYEDKMNASIDVLSIVSPNQSTEELVNLWGSELALDNIYNHIWDGGELEKLETPLEHAVYHQAKKPEEYVGVFEDTNGELIPAVADQSVYVEVMANPEIKDPAWFEENTTRVPSYQ